MDTKTVLISYLISNAICAAIIFALWYQNRKQFNGLGFWLAAYVMQFAGLTLIIMRVYLPEFVSVVVGNGIIIGGTILLYMGLERFLWKRSNQFHNYILLALFVAVHIYFLVIRPNMTARSLNLSFVSLALCTQFVWLIFRRTDVKLRPVVRGAGFVFAAYGAVSLIRICANSVMPLDDDFFQLDSFNTLLILTYQMLFIALTFSLFLMVNRCLLMGLQEDMVIRQRAEDASNFSEQQYRNFIAQSFEAISRTEFDHPIDITLPVEEQIDRIYENAFMAECNQAMADMYHVPSPEAFVGMRLIDAHGGKDDPINRKTFRKLIENGYKSVNDETREYTVDGKPIWFLSNTIGMVENGYLVRLWGTAIDITEQKRMEATLRASEASMRSLIENVKDIFVRYDLSLRYQYVSPVIQRFLDATPESFIGKTHREAGFPEDKAEFFDASLREAIESKKPVDVEFSLQGRGGEYIMQTHVYPELDEKGIVISVVTVTSDITERKQMEEALGRSQLMYKDLVERQGVGVYRIRVQKYYSWGEPDQPHYEYEFVNDEYCRLTGASREEHFADPTLTLKLIHPEDYPSFAKKNEEVDITNEPFVWEGRMIVRGEIRWMHYESRSRNFPDIGKVWTGILMDITERKQAEEALHASEERFRQLIISAPDAVFVVDQEGKITFSNMEATNLLGYTPDEFTGMDVENLIPQKLREGHIVNRAKYMSNPHTRLMGSQLNLSAVRKDGSETPVDVKLSPVKMEAKTHVIAFMRDITERKQAEEELIKAKKEAEENEARFRKSLEFSPTPMAVADHTGKLIFLNKNFIDTYGYTLQDIPTIAQWMLQAYPDTEYRNSYLQQWGQDSEYAVKNNTTTPLRECQVTCKSGEVKTVAIMAYFEKDLIIGHFQDISERTQVEEALRLEQEFVNNALDTQQDTFFLFDFTSGKALRWNRAFREISGYSDEEIAALPAPVSYYSAEDLARENDVIQRIMQGEPASVVMNLICKDGRKIATEYQAAPLKDEKGDYRFIIAIGRDITERKQAEEMMHMRLRLFEYANDHSIEELLQKALDEIGLFTNSPIGFYHFIEPDQKTVSLQAWSTRTLTEFCRAEGKGIHYDIDQAGVWVDCVHQQKPVIHNDFASPPHRKGLPPDHAEVKRELIVPILRKGNIVSILGIGNKPSNYNEKDVEFVSYVADIVWTIVERKRVAEALQRANATLHTQLAEIHALKESLQEQAIRDPLTNLHNRRYLDDTLEHEIARAKRENYPLSIMMIDVDYFKNFNDVYGHSAGDEVLKSVSRLLVASIRQGDIACRYGGEEFLIVMVGAHEADVERRADAIRRDFSRLRIRADKTELSATISIGVAFYPRHGAEIQQVIGAADAAMYQAKQAGRNRIQVWQEGE